jgi:cytochrome c oxidase subunit 3
MSKDSSTHPAGHPYHLVDPSTWPMLSSLAAGCMLGGAALYFHGYKPWLSLIGLVGVLGCMFGWWRNVVHEAVGGGHHTSAVQRGLRLGMALFIVSELMFFVAFFWSFFNASFFPTEAVGGVWPPKGIKTLDAMEFPLLNTLILLLSGCTVTWAHEAIRQNVRVEVVQALLITVLLGLIFSAVQAFEYHHTSFAFKDGVYPSNFFMATGFHGFHVIVGTTFLLVCLLRARKGHFKPDHHFGFEAAAWYWHFVDVVWLFLFVSIYLEAGQDLLPVIRAVGWTGFGLAALAIAFFASVVVWQWHLPILKRLTHYRRPLLHKS